MTLNITIKNCHTQHNDSQQMALETIMLSVIYAEYRK